MHALMIVYECKRSHCYVNPLQRTADECKNTALKKAENLYLPAVLLCTVKHAARL